MKKRRCSAFEIMFKNKLLEEKDKPVRERRILFPSKYADNGECETVIDIAAYREEFERTDSNDDGYVDVDEFGKFLRSIGLNPTDGEVKVTKLERTCWVIILAGGFRQHRQGSEWND